MEHLPLWLRKNSKLHKKADLTSKYSLRDLVEQFRKVYTMDLDCQMILTEVPKKIGEIEKNLNLRLFPK